MTARRVLAVARFAAHTQALAPGTWVGLLLLLGVGLLGPLISLKNHGVWRFDATMLGTGFAFGALFVIRSGLVEHRVGGLQDFLRRNLVTPVEHMAGMILSLLAAWFGFSAAGFLAALVLSGGDVGLAAWTAWIHLLTLGLLLPAVLWVECVSDLRTPLAVPGFVYFASLYGLAVAVGYARAAELMALTADRSWPPSSLPLALRSAVVLGLGFGVTLAVTATRARLRRRPRAAAFVLALLVLVGCGDGGPDDPLVVRSFLARSTPLACLPVAASAGMAGTAVTALRVASDSTVLVLDGPGRAVRELDSRLAVLWELHAPVAGPGSLDGPVDAVFLGDTAVVIAEGSGASLIVYGRDGTLIRTTRLPFAPHSLAARPSGDVLVTAAAVAGHPTHLLFSYAGEDAAALAVPARPYADVMAGALGNLTLVDVVGGEAAVVVHRLLAPRAFRVDSAGGVEPLRMPTPDATRALLSYVPASPFGPETLPRVLAPALAMSVDRGRGEVYLLTRSGRTLDGRPERAILRTDARLRPLGSYLIDVRARAIAYLAGPESMLLVDDRDRFHSCPLRSVVRAKPVPSAH